MKNVDLKVDGTKLTITVDLAKSHGASSSGKSLTVATSEGNQDIPGFAGFKIGLNVYKPNPEYTKK